MGYASNKGISEHTLKFIITRSEERRGGNALIFKCYFLRRAHSTEQTPLMMVFTSFAHFTTESTEAMQIKCLAQGHNILMKPEFEPPIAVSRNQHLNHMTNSKLKEYYLVDGEINHLMI